MRPIVGMALAGAVVAGALFPAAAPAAQALPGSCRAETTWHNGTTSYRESDGALVETGIYSTNRWTCDFVEYPGGDPSTGYEVGGPPSSGPPAPLIPSLPKPPASVPPGAAPPCVTGANNSTHPGRADGDQTGSGGIVVENIEVALATGDVKIDTTGPSKVVSIDVNVGESMSGDRAVNPFEGIDPLHVPDAMYWPNAYDPTYTEAGWGLKTLKNVAKQMMRAVTQGDLAANSAWKATWAKLPYDKRQIVIDIVKERIKTTQATWKNDVPEQVKWVIEGLWEVLELAAEIPGPVSDDSISDVDAAALYVDASIAPRLPGEGWGHRGSQSACGQVSKATVTTGAALTGLTTGPEWVRVTLEGTEHGTLIEKLKALPAPSAYCPPVHVDLIAGQDNLTNVLEGCTGSITSARVLTRGEFAALTLADRTLITSGFREDTGSDSATALQFATLSLPGWLWSTSTSLLNDGHAGFTGDSADGVLSYPLPLAAAGKGDALVAVATDASGDGHPFLIQVAVKAPPSCSTADRVVGPNEDHFRAVIQDGALQLVRNVPFTLDLKTLCTTDFRDTYTVVMNGEIEGTTHTINADGTVSYTWTDPDAVGSTSKLSVTAYDIETGAPSAASEIGVTVRDVAPVCNDVELEYDRSELKGAPLTIPLVCGMEGGLKVLSPAFLRIVGGAASGTTLVVEGGTFAVGAHELTFTPSAVNTEVSTAQILPWATDPTVATPYPVTGKRFDVDVRVSE
jgi:hypothetical protein